MRTLLVQSFRTHDVPHWLRLCLDSVRGWAQQQAWDYQFIDDRFFSLAPDWVRQRCAGNLYALTDICRLLLLRQRLADGYDNVLWADADLLVFAPQTFRFCGPHDHAFAHELFVALDDSEAGYTPRYGLNNALMQFRRGSAVLDAYHDAAMLQLTQAAPGPLPRTALGPALLQQLATHLPLHAAPGVGLFSLAVMREIADGGGPVARACARLSPGPLGAANLCHFLRNEQSDARRPLFDRVYERAVLSLLESAGASLAC